MNAIASARMEPGVVRQQLDRILQSSQFVETTRLRRFLKYLVEQTVAGNDAALKGYSIGLDVFDKPDDFDPGIDTIVRVQASKLRSRLELYYATDGANDPLRILVPKGSYVPVFQVAFDPAVPSETYEKNTNPPETTQRYSIAVLPFDNLSGNPDQEFLADGFTEEILNALAKFREFQVMSRYSTFRYKNKKGDARDIGAALGVRYILEGSVRRWKDQVRVTSQLIDAETGVHLLSEVYDDDISVQSLFDIQEVIASQIAAEIAEPHGVIHKLGAPKREAATHALDAYECRLLACEYWRNPSEDTHAKVVKLLERAVAIDPNYAGAWAMLAILYGDEVRGGYFREHKVPALDRALDAAKRAVAIDPKDAAGYHALFMTHFNRGEIAAYKAAANRALALNPNYPDLLADYGACLSFIGEWDEGLTYLRRAIELSPDPPGWYRAALAVQHYVREEYEKALEVIEGVELGSFYWGSLIRAMIHGQLGNTEEAQQNLQRTLDRFPDFASMAEPALGIWNFEPKVVSHFLDGWKKAGLQISA